jgi:hypothetical protein
VSDFEASWYGGAWRAAREAPLYPPLPAGTIAVYRFTWLRTFHHPVVVRVDRRADGARLLTAKELSGQGGYAMGTVDRQLSRPLSQAEADKLDSLLASTHVVDLSATECNLGGADGAQWIIEAQAQGRYRYVNRWSPKQGPVRDVGLLLLGFTGWNPSPVY